MLLGLCFVFFFLASVSSSHALWPSCKNDWSRLLVSSESHALAVTVGEEWATNAKPGGHCSWDTPPARSICLLNSDHSLIYAHTVHRDMIQLGTWGRECEYMSLDALVHFIVSPSAGGLPLHPSISTLTTIILILGIILARTTLFASYHRAPATSLSLYEILRVKAFYTMSNSSPIWWLKIMFYTVDYIILFAVWSLNMSMWMSKLLEIILSSLGML